MHSSKYPKPLSLFSHTPEVMTHQILQREMYKTLIFPLAFGLERCWPIGQLFGHQSDALCSNPTRGILQWLRGRIVSPSVVGILLACSDNPKVTFFLLILFCLILCFFPVNIEVETRREEPGYEVGQNLDPCYFLTILDHF